MAKKTHIKVRMVPEANPDSAFIYYAKKPTKGEKAKNKLKLRKYNPNTKKHEIFVEKNYHLTVNNYLFLKFLNSYSIKPLIIDFHILFVILGSIFIFFDLFLILRKIILILFLSTMSFLNFLFFII